MKPNSLSGSRTRCVAPLRGGERCLVCAAGCFTGAGTVALSAERALGPAVARVRDALDSGAPLDAESALALAGLVALAERFEPLMHYPTWAWAWQSWRSSAGLARSPLA